MNALGQDSRDDLPLAVIECDVCRMLPHERPPFARGSVLARTRHDYAKRAGPRESGEGATGGAAPHRSGTVSDTTEVGGSGPEARQVD